jgi:hypothetical protein
MGPLGEGLAPPLVTLRSLLALGTPRSPPVPSQLLRRTNKEKNPMAVFNGAFPILPGKETRRKGLRGRVHGGAPQGVRSSGG